MIFPWIGEKSERNRGHINLRIVRQGLPEVSRVLPDISEYEFIRAPWSVIKSYLVYIHRLAFEPDHPIGDVGVCLMDVIEILGLHAAPSRGGEYQSDGSSPQPRVYHWC